MYIVVQTKNLNEIIDETRNYFPEEIEQNELLSRKQKKVCTTLKYIEHSLILASTITGCIWFPGFFFFFLFH